MSKFQAEKVTLRSGANMKKTSSQLMLALSAQNLDEDSESDTTAHDTEETKQVSSLALGVKVRRSDKLNALTAEQKNPEKFKQEIGAEKGYDLSKISTHYNHRRMLRREKMVFRYGELATLRCMNDDLGTD